MFGFFIFLFVSKYDKISSTVFPLVSGMINIANKMFNTQKPAKTDQTISAPYFSIISGYILQIKNQIIYPKA